MNLRPIAGVIALSLIGAAGAAAPAQAAPAQKAAGERSLVKVLAADGTKFDSKWGDFDIVERAALTVLKAKPNSPVGVLAKGKVRLTAFIPTDLAFRRLVRDLTGQQLGSEKKVFNAVATLGVDTIETVLLYHVVPGSTITSADAAASDGARLKTAQGGKIKVDVRDGHIFLIDADRNDHNPRVKPEAVDINKGNKQIAHGINRVLRPVDL